MTRKYTKRNKRYWYPDHYFNLLGYLLLILLAIMMVVAWMWRDQELISPVPDFIPQAHAEEIVIPCEKGVAELLECRAVAGEITFRQAKIMLAIAKAESNLKERAANRHSTARGVFQIIASTWYNYDCVGDKYSWKDNTICAIKIMKRSGYTPWEVYNTGSYLRYLNGSN
jgi:hypothetical protein